MNLEELISRFVILYFIGLLLTGLAFETYGPTTEKITPLMFTFFWPILLVAYPIFAVIYSVCYCYSQAVQALDNFKEWFRS